MESEDGCGHQSDGEGGDEERDPMYNNAMNVIGGQRDKLQDLIVTLRGQRDTLKESKKVLAKQLKAAQRKKQRLKKKAKELSTTDIIDVLIMRKAAQATAKAKPNKKKDTSP